MIMPPTVLHFFQICLQPLTCNMGGWNCQHRWRRICGNNTFYLCDRFVRSALTNFNSSSFPLSSRLIKHILWYSAYCNRPEAATVNKTKQSLSVLDCWGKQVFRLTFKESVDQLSLLNSASAKKKYSPRWSSNLSLSSAFIVQCHTLTQGHRRSGIYSEMPANRG